jgi:4-carboxymuconolactone decarboxylase
VNEDGSVPAARAVRRAVLGDAYVDAQAAGAELVAVEFQDFISSRAQGTWARIGALNTRDRSLLVLANPPDCKNDRLLSSGRISNDA